MFITFEGPEGSGKTTQMAALARFLRQQGYEVLATREPGGTTIGDQVREILFNPHNTDMLTKTEVLLFQASRAQLVEQVVRPCLEQNGIVLCDRYADSTLAYQGYGYYLEIDELQQIINFATDGLLPDLTLLLDVEVEVGLQRKVKDGDCEWNRLDAYEIEFHRRVRQGYLELAANEPERWVMIDAGQPPEFVQAAVRKIVMERLA